MANENVFKGKAPVYNSRPTYPQECIDYLVSKFHLSPESVIADIGAGTGILTKPFLEIGATVYAVEPNEDMFGELNRNLSHYETLRVVQASAEETKIPSSSCDAVVVGTAFHWFDKELFRAECKRILRGNKYAAILRISNNSEADKRLDAINHHTEEDLNEAKAFFGNGFSEHIRFEYSQSFDEERYINNLLSSATAPLPGDKNFDACLQKWQTVFHKYFPTGIAELPFAVDCFIGQL